MNICEPFIRRPVMTTLVMAGLLIFGLMGYSALPVSDLPNVDFPTIVVVAGLPGASPETMASSVATPLEQQFSAIAGIDSMTSSSSLGQTQIVLQFDLDRNIDSVAQDVQSAISIASHKLPTNLPTPPIYHKVNPAAAPVLYLVLTSKTASLSLINKYAETIMAQRISMVNGVAQVNVYGQQKYAVRAQLNPELLAARGISLSDVSRAISEANVNLPTGTLNGAQQSLPITVEGQLTHAAAYRSLVVAYRNGAPVRLQQLGRVVDDVQNNQTASWFNNKRAVVLAIQRQPGTNTLAVVNKIKQLLPAFQQQLPAAIKLEVAYDRSVFVRASVHDVQLTLLTAALLVILVIFLFLRNLSATIIPSVVLPFSLIATFAAMYWLNFSLDNISLLGLTLMVGFVVDDAIVMMENIVRHMERGEAPLQAAISGSKEVGFTILSMTLSLMAVFIPVLFMGGIVGRLLNEFAVTTCAAILLSGFISLTLTPMLCSRFLRSDQPATHSKFYQLTENFFNNLLAYYQSSLQWVLNHRRFTLITFALTLLLSAGLFMAVPKGFLPNEDIGQLLAYTEADAGIAFPEMVKRQQTVMQIIQQDPNVLATMSFVGAGGASPLLNQGRIFIKLKPRSQRALHADEIIEELRPKLKEVPGMSVFLQNIPSIPVGGRTTKSTLQYTLQASDLAELRTWTQRFQDRLKKLPELRSVTSDLLSTSPEVRLQIDRDKAAALGVTTKELENTLANAFGTQQVSTIYTPIDTYEVIIELEPRYQLDANVLSQLYVHSAGGQLIPLTAVVTMQQNAAPLTVNHQGQLPAATISFDLKPDVSLGQAVRAVRAVEQELQPPPTLNADFQGSAKAFKSTQTDLGVLLLLAVIVIYIILGILYESFIHPLTILSGLPAAAMGALVALLITHTELDFYAFIGIIMLVGIVKKNAIMMVDFAIAAQREEHKNPLTAITQACLIRFRPIMMTTAAALLGTLPIALALGQGSEARRSLGIAVVGGLLLSQFLTLYITPVIYLYLEALRTKLK